MSATFKFIYSSRKLDTFGKWKCTNLWKLSKIHIYHFETPYAKIVARIAYLKVTRKFTLFFFALLFIQSIQSKIIKAFFHQRTPASCVCRGVFFVNQNFDFIFRFSRNFHIYRHTLTLNNIIDSAGTEELSGISTRKVRHGDCSLSLFIFPIENQKSLFLKLEIEP